MTPVLTSRIKEGKRTGKTDCMYLVMKKFIMPPDITMQGSIDVNARAKRHDRMYARMKPQTKAPIATNTSAIFSDIPC